MRRLIVSLDGVARSTLPFDTLANNGARAWTERQLASVDQTSGATQSLKLASVFRPMRQAERIIQARCPCIRTTQVPPQHDCWRLLAMFDAQQHRDEKRLTASGRPKPGAKRPVAVKCGRLFCQQEPTADDSMPEDDNWVCASFVNDPNSCDHASTFILALTQSYCRSVITPPSNSSAPGNSYFFQRTKSVSSGPYMLSKSD